MTGTRADLLHWMDWGVSHAPAIHYSQRRPMPLACPPALPLYTDCSASLTILCHCAGIPDPNGLDYNGTGYTGTMFYHMTHIARSQALPGDFGIYSRYGVTTHVIALYQAGTTADPLVFSHGSEIGPLKLRLSSENAAHSGETLTWCRLPVTGDPPGGDMTPQDVADQIENALTGYNSGIALRSQGKPRPDAKDHPMIARGWNAMEVIIQTTGGANPPTSGTVHIEGDVTVS